MSTIWKTTIDNHYTASVERTAPLTPMNLLPELLRWLDAQSITPANLVRIQRRCFVPWASAWNSIVREETVRRCRRGLRPTHGDEDMSEPLYHCPRCQRVTPHSHTHQVAHGLTGTHMEGSEQFCCLVCEESTFASDPHAHAYPFVLDCVTTQPPLAK